MGGGHANALFKSFLMDRRKYTTVNGVLSVLGAATCGVPKGSVLGPLLFSLYINDINTLFADDTFLLISDNNLDTVTQKAKSQFTQ